MHVIDLGPNQTPSFLNGIEFRTQEPGKQEKQAVAGKESQNGSLPVAPNKKEEK